MKGTGIRSKGEKRARGKSWKKHHDIKKGVGNNLEYRKEKKVKKVKLNILPCL